MSKPFIYFTSSFGKGKKSLLGRKVSENSLLLWKEEKKSLYSFFDIKIKPAAPGENCQCANSALKRRHLLTKTRRQRKSSSSSEENRKKSRFANLFSTRKISSSKRYFHTKKGIGLDFLPNNTLPISYAIPFSLSFFSNRILLPLQSYIWVGKTRDPG